MNSQPYSNLIRYKQWADRGLYGVLAQDFDRLNAQDAAIMVRILDHIHVVDRVFQHHLRGLPHGFCAARSEVMPEFRTLAEGSHAVDDWYVSHVGNLSAPDFDQPLNFVYTNGTPARMTRGEIILHVCLHGTYHRGNAGLLLQKNGIVPNDDRMTDFLETVA
jgi:uncharacterized damage-inducible protein DinB